MARPEFFEHYRFDEECKVVEEYDGVRDMSQV